MNEEERLERALKIDGEMVVFNSIQLSPFRRVDSLNFVLDDGEPYPYPICGDTLRKNGLKNPYARYNAKEIEVANK